MTNSEKGDNPISDVPRVSEDTWLGLAIAFAIFTVLGLLYAFWWVFLDPAVGNNMGTRSRSITPFLAAGAAAVTIFSVLWRGAINSRQADEQKRQNDSQDEANLALLLDKAATYLIQEDMVSKRVGVSMLRTIVSAPQSGHKPAAVHLAAGQLGPLFLHHHFEGKQLAKEISDFIVYFGRQPDYEISMLFADFGSHNANNFELAGQRTKYFQINLLFPPAAFMNGYFSISPVPLPSYCVEDAIQRFAVSRDWQNLTRDNAKWTFHNCFIRSSDDLPRGVFSFPINNCFTLCTFFRVNPTAIGMCHGYENKLVECDLSGTIYATSGCLTDVSYEGCFYRPDDPPKFYEGHQLRNFDEDQLRNLHIGTNG